MPLWGTELVLVKQALVTGAFGLVGEVAGTVTHSLRMVRCEKQEDRAEKNLPALSLKRGQKVNSYTLISSYSNPHFTREETTQLPHNI